MSDPLPIPKIVSMLTERADDLARRLLPNGTLQGRDWYCSGSRSPTGHAISVAVSGPKQGVVGFWGGREKPGGDLLDLIQAIDGGTKGEAVKEAKRLLGLDQGGTIDLEKERQRIKRQRKRQAAAKDEAERRIQVARVIWEGCEAVTDGTAADRYLRRRGLPPSLEWSSTLALGAHPGLKHPAGGVWPCFVGRLTGPGGGFRGIWRIYLTTDGNKAPVSNPKLGLGSAKGSAVYLTPRAPVLHVAEGIESALAALALTRELLDGPEDAVCASLSTSGMAGLEIPEGTHRVVIWPDADVPKERNGAPSSAPGWEAARRLAQRCEDEGIEAVLPPQSETGRDPLDIWLRMRDLRDA